MVVNWIDEHVCSKQRVLWNYFFLAKKSVVGVNKLQYYFSAFSKQTFDVGSRKCTDGTNKCNDGSVPFPVIHDNFPKIVWFPWSWWTGPVNNQLLCFILEGMDNSSGWYPQVRWSRLICILDQKACAALQSWSKGGLIYMTYIKHSGHFRFHPQGFKHCHLESPQ